MSLSTTRSSTSGCTSSNTGEGASAAASTDRISFTGYGTTAWDVLDAHGASMRTNGGAFHGYNLGAYGSHGGVNAPNTIAAAVAQVIADGAKCVRPVGYNRWFGSYNKSPGADSRDDLSYASFNPVNWRDLRDLVRGTTNAGIWTTITHDSDCGQAGTQDSSTFNTVCNFPQPGEVPMTMDSSGNWTVIPGSPTWLAAGGYNYFTSQFLFNKLNLRWLLQASEFVTYPKIFAYEVLSEPLPVDANSVGPAYDNVSTFNGLTWPQRIANLVRVLRATIRTVDKRTPIIAGSWDGYGLDQLADLVPLLSDLTDIMYTWDNLDGGSSPPNHIKQAGRCQEAMLNKVPLYMNQFGTRNDTAVDPNPHDPNSYGMNAGYAVFRAYGIACIWWESREAVLSTSNLDYGLQYSTDGGHTWIDKPQQLNYFRAAMGYTVTSMTAAANAAIDASTSGVEFYVNASLPGAPTNAWKDVHNGAAVTQVNDLLGYLSPSRGTGLNFANTVAGTLPKVLQSAVTDVSGVSMLPDKFPAIIGDGLTQFLKGDTTFFTLGSEDQTIIMAVAPGAISSNQFLLGCGNSAGSSSYPLIRFAASGVVQAIWADGTTTSTCAGTTVLKNIPCVITAKKVGNVKTLYVNGLQEATDSTAITTVAPSRLNLLADSHNTVNYPGSATYLFACKNGLSDAARMAIERRAAHMVGAPYQF